MLGVSDAFNPGMEPLFYILVFGFWIASAVLARYYIKKI